MTDTYNNMAPTDRFDVFFYEKYYANGRCMVKEGDSTLVMTETTDSYVKQVFPPDPSTVATQTTYFADMLTVSSTGQFIKQWNIEIGVWRQYDKDGNLINEVDKDKHYPVKWEEMKAHFLENGIHVNDIRMLRRTKDKTTRRYLWILTIKSSHGILDIAHFDAATGDLIKRTQTQIKMA